MKLLAMALFSLTCLTACGSNSFWPIVDSGYAISGTITYHGALLSGVSVTLSDGSTGKATTDATGVYRFKGVKNGSYSLYPAKSGYSFTPAALPLTIKDADASGINFIALVAPAPTAIQLPKTGVTFSYRAGDDGNLQKGIAWPDPRFVDNYDGTVTDNLTGLIWLKNADCFGTVVWKDALTASNTLTNGSCGLIDNSKAGDWRLPNINELSSLISLGSANPTLPLNPFNKIQSASYWSSTTFAEAPDSAWLAYFDVGYSDTLLKSNYVHVLPVKSKAISALTIGLAKTGQTTSYAEGDDGNIQQGAVPPDHRFTDNGDGTVIDQLTNLVWLKDANCLDDTKPGISKIKNYGQLRYPDGVTWTSGLASGYCGLSDGSVAGDWRIPNRNELKSLIDRSQFKPAIPFDHPFKNVQSGVYWSTSNLAADYTSEYIWIGYMDNGIEIVAASKSSLVRAIYVWPVRDVK